jgi:cytoskeletal protein CcmA (bactofilin family)
MQAARSGTCFPSDLRIEDRCIEDRSTLQILAALYSASLRRTSMSAPLSADLAQIGKSVVIKGELSGSEDLYVDGQVEGSISLKGNSLTVGPHGTVKATVEAKGVVVQGKLEGNVQASDRVDLRKSAVVTGDIATQRISIEEGAYLKGKVDIQGKAEKAAGK